MRLNKLCNRLTCISYNNNPRIVPISLSSLSSSLPSCLFHTTSQLDSFNYKNGQDSEQSDYATRSSKRENKKVSVTSTSNSLVNDSNSSPSMFDSVLNSTSTNDKLESFTKKKNGITKQNIEESPKVPGDKSKYVSPSPSTSSTSSSIPIRVTTSSTSIPVRVGNARPQDLRTSDDGWPHDLQSMLSHPFEQLHDTSSVVDINKRRQEILSKARKLREEFPTAAAGNNNNATSAADTPASAPPTAPTVSTSNRVVRHSSNPASERASRFLDEFLNNYEQKIKDEKERVVESLKAKHKVEQQASSLSTPSSPSTQPISASTPLSSTDNTACIHETSKAQATVVAAAATNVASMAASTTSDTTPISVSSTPVPSSPSPCSSVSAALPSALIHHIQHSLTQPPSSSLCTSTPSPAPAARADNSPIIRASSDVQAWQNNEIPILQQRKEEQQAIHLPASQSPVQQDTIQSQSSTAAEDTTINATSAAVTAAESEISTATAATITEDNTKKSARNRKIIPNTQRRLTARERLFPLPTICVTDRIKSQLLCKSERKLLTAHEELLKLHEKQLRALPICQDEALVLRRLYFDLSKCMNLQLSGRKGAADKYNKLLKQIAMVHAIARSNNKRRSAQQQLHCWQQSKDSVQYSQQQLPPLIGLIDRMSRQLSFVKWLLLFAFCGLMHVIYVEYTLITLRLSLAEHQMRTQLLSDR